SRAECCRSAARSAAPRTRAEPASSCSVGSATPRSPPCSPRPTWPTSRPATITLPDRTGQPLTGKVSQVSPAGTTSGRLVRYPVMVAFDQVPTDLLYGQSANVVITTQSVSNVLYVSSSAVRPGADGSATVTVRANGQDQQRTVQIGLRGDQYTEIRSGLSEGDSVVTGGR